MRFFSFLFAVYFLSLSLAPCSDEIFIDNCGSSQSCSHLETPHSDDCGGSDACNPLCVCNCCGSVTVVSNSDNNIIAQLPTEQLSIYTHNSPSEISFSIWQPPKIG